MTRRNFIPEFFDENLNLKNIKLNEKLIKYLYLKVSSQGNKIKIFKNKFWYTFCLFIRKNYNFGKIGKIDYKFSLDHNYEDLNYNEISTSLNFGKVEFNLDYLEEQNHIGSENYVNSGISLNFSDNNKLSFQTKKNFKTDSTELYDISYQYTNDCLTAGLVFRREFYEDSDIEQKDSLMFKITFVPFTSARAPIKTPWLILKKL